MTKPSASHRLLRHALIAAAALSLSGAAVAAYNEQRAGVSLSYPATYDDWVNAFLAGNGKMGIMVFGNPLAETVIYNDRGFNFAKTKDRSFSQVSAADLAQIKAYCAAGNFQAANDLAVSSANYQGGGEGNRHPGYEMLISIPPDGAVSNYSRTCDFRTGEIIVKWTDNRGNWERRAFVSRKDNVTVQYLPAPSGGKLTCSIQLATDPGMKFWIGGGEVVFTKVSNTNTLNIRGKYPSNTVGGGGYEGVTRVIVNGGTKSLTGNVLNITNADSVLLLTRTAKYPTNCETQWNQQLLQGQLAALPASYQTLLDGQIATHGAIYDRVKIDLGASAEDRAKTNEELLAMQKTSNTAVKALWERIFDAGRYYYLSSSSDQTPPDLLGIWTGDTDAGWGGFYHLDANLNVQIAGGNIGDMPEAMEGYFHIVEAWRTDFQTNARKLLGTRGMVAAGNTPGLSSGLISSMSDYYPYAYATGEASWLLYPFWEHYLITGDQDFLRNRLYPLLKDMAQLYEDFLVHTDANGKYIFAGSISPENQPSNVKVSLLNNSSFDIAGAKFALSALIQTCNTLGLDQGPGGGVEKWTAILNKLPPYLVNADGAIQEWSWPGLIDNYGHRHSSGLVGVWPYREITPEANPALYQAAVTTLGKKDTSPYENAGHGLLHSGLIAAVLKNEKSVNTKLMRFTKEDYYYGTLFASHYNDHGTFCADVCNAVPGIMMEMLVASNPGELELLPALPQALDTGAVSGIKGRNRVTVENLSWDTAAKTVSCTLKSDIDQTLTLIQRDGIATIETSATVEPSPLGQIARKVHLQAGVSTSVTLGLAGLKPINLAYNRPVTVSSTADSSPGPNVVDGLFSTRWSSAYSNNQWIYVDLGEVKNITSVKLYWQNAYATAYKLQVSQNASSWADVYSTTSSEGGIQEIPLSTSGRYVRMLGVQRATIYGYSLWELEVYGPGGAVAPAPPATPAQLSAVAGDGQVALSWNASPGALSYHVKRATGSGGPYATIASPVSTAYTDAGAANGTAYYYVVSAENDEGESGDSSQAGATPAAMANLALGRPVTVSSTNGNYPASNTVDGNTATRWSSDYSNNQWIYVDLGATASISKVVLRWEAAYASSYRVQTSSDASSWTDVASTTSGDGGVDQLNFTANARYVRMLGVTRATTYGYSLWEFEVWGSLPAAPVVSVTATDPTAQKGTANGGAFTFTRTGATTAALQVSFSVSQASDQAVYSTDYSLDPAPPGITIPASQASAAVTVTPIDRLQPTGSLAITVTVGPGAGYSVGAASSATVQLLDSPINLWKIAEFGGLAAAQSPLAADDADADSDGDANLFEFALGHKPLVANDGPTAVGTVEEIGGESYLTYTFSRPRPAPGGEEAYIVETSSTLNGSDWTPATPVSGYPVDLGNGTEQIKFRSVHPTDTRKEEFIRLRVSRP